MEQFLKDATVATSDIELWNAFARHWQSQGIEFITYTQLDAGNIIPRRTWGQLPGFPEDWTERYKAGLWEADPVRSLAALLPTPFRWSQIETIRPLSGDEMAFKAEIDGIIGSADALIVPVFGQGGRNGYFAVSLPDSETEVPPLLLAQYRVVCQYTHQRRCELVAPEHTQSTPLSEREREVLKWVARGKSNSVIADILGVSPNTVDTHLRRIYKKLDVCDRVSAALAGLHKRMITLN